MEFPVTIESQEAFDQLIKPRLEREKTKQSDLEKQVEALTAEKQDLETKVTDLESRATAAEQWKSDREAQDEHAKITKAVADEFGITPEALKGATEEELRAHAEILQPLIQQPAAPVLPNVGDQPQDNKLTGPEVELLQELGLSEG